MNICAISFIYPNPDHLVLGSFVHEQLAELAKHNKVHLITRTRNHWSCPDEETIKGVHIHRVDSENQFLFPLKCFMKIITLNGKYHFDVIHSHFTGYLTLFCSFASALIRKPFFITAYGITLDPKSISSLKRAVIRISFFFAKKIISISRYTKELSENYAPKNKHTLITPGIEPSKLKVTINSKEFRRKHKLGNGPLLLSIGGLVWRKGFDISISIMPDIVRKYPDAKLVIIGKGPEEANLKKLTKKLKLEKNVIFWPTWVSDEDLANFYNACDIFILMNITKGEAVQGFGIVYVEANALGKPIIGGEGGGISDATVDKKAGFIINPYDKELLKEKLFILIKNKKLRKKMGDFGKEYALKNHPWEYKAKQLINLYSKFVQGQN